VTCVDSGGVGSEQVACLFLAGPKNKSGLGGDDGVGGWSKVAL